MAWDTVGEFLAFVAATGLIAAAFNQGILWLRERTERDRKASYLALRVAAILETYVHDALDERSRMLYDIERDGAPTTFSMGEIAEFPNEPESWAMLPKSLAGRVMNLKMNAANEGRYLAHVSMHSDPHSLAGEYCDSIIDVSLDAWLLAQEIRTQFGFPIEGKVNETERENRTGLFLEKAANEIEARRKLEAVID